MDQESANKAWCAVAQCGLKSARQVTIEPLGVKTLFLQRADLVFNLRLLAGCAAKLQDAAPGPFKSNLSVLLDLIQAFAAVFSQ